MKCPQCDFENEEGSKFCKNCNVPLFKQDYPKNNLYSKNIVVNGEDKIKKGNFKIIKEHLILLLGVGLFIFGIFSPSTVTWPIVKTFYDSGSLIKITIGVILIIIWLLKIRENKNKN